MYKINNYQPVEGTIVKVETNWSTYVAKFQKSFFGGYEFSVLGGCKKVQLTTVKGWEFFN